MGHDRHDFCDVEGSGALALTSFSGSPLRRACWAARLQGHEVGGDARIQTRSLVHGGK